MYRFIFIPFLVVFLSINSISSQTVLTDFTHTIIDTNTSQFEQAEAIYKWIISNVEFDLDAYKKHELNDYQSTVILKKKKGLNNNFANLYTDMCNSVGIEAYSIYGYFKDIEHYEGRTFLRSNYLWNVLVVDSVMIMADPLRGKGYLMKRPGVFNKFLFHIVRIPYTNTKYIFTSKPDTSWFNIDLDTLLKTHYPADPKWLMTKNPQSFYFFETGEMPEFTTNNFYESEIEKVRNNGKDFLFKQDGLNANKFNNHNFYDLAAGSFRVALEYDLDRNISDDNIVKYKMYRDEYELILNSISKHKDLTDSVFKARFKSLKKLSSDQKRLSKKTITKAKRAKQSYRSGKEKIGGKTTSYKKKQEKYTINIGKAEINRLDYINTDDSIRSNVVSAADLYVNFLELEKTKPELYFKLDSITTHIDKRLSLDVNIDDSIKIKNNEFTIGIKKLNSIILIGKEKDIFNYVDSLKAIDQAIIDYNDQKKSLRSDIEHIGKDYFSYTSILEKNLRNQMTVLKKMYKESNYRDTIYNKHNKTVDELVEAYEKAIEFTYKLSSNNTIQIDSEREIMLGLKEQKRNVKKEDKFFKAWWEYTYKKEKERYNFEKGLIKPIKSGSGRGLKVLENKIIKYQSQKEK